MSLHAVKWPTSLSSLVKISELLSPPARCCTFIKLFFVIELMFLCVDEISSFLKTKEAPK